MLKEHPKGLIVLFFTEMWERFGYYLMLGILFLYMTDTDTGGMALGQATAADIMGTYLALVYLTPFIGGLLADRILGYRLSVFIGGLLMAIGYLGLAMPGPTAFWISIFLIVIGNGFFKPNMSTLVGNLYADKTYAKLKDSGYNIFYMGVNIGAFVCNFVAAYLRNNFGWGYAFAAAGIGMLIGVIWFLTGQHTLKYADQKKPVSKKDMSLAKIFSIILLPMLVFGYVGWILPGNLFGTDSTDAFLLGSVPVVIFYLTLWFRASTQDKNPIGALLFIFGVVIIFWAIFHQNATALTLWAEKYTDRHVAESVEPMIEPFGMIQEADTSPREISKLDMHGRQMLNEQGKVLKEIGPDPYFRNIPKDEWPPEGKSVKLISTEIFQSINPFFVVVLTPLVVGFFGWLRKRGREPSTPGKIGWGLFITALSTMVMIGAVFASQNGMQKSSPLWLVGAYGVITIGELFLSPMGLSLVSKLSPPRLTSVLMGGWFLATSLGNKMSGVLASLWGMYEHKAWFFVVNFSGAMFAAVMILIMIKWLRNVVETHAR